MEKITWTDEYIIGVPEIDSEHQRIVRLLNKLLETTSSSVSDEMISVVLNELTTIELDHFKQEERILEEQGYPNLTKEKAEHRAFIKDTAEICMAVVDGKTDVTEDIQNHLRDLWLNHILDEVKNLRPFFENKQ